MPKRQMPLSRNRRRPTRHSHLHRHRRHGPHGQSIVGSHFHQHEPGHHSLPHSTLDCATWNGDYGTGNYNNITPLDEIKNGTAFGPFGPSVRWDCGEAGMCLDTSTGAPPIDCSIWPYNDSSEGGSCAPSPSVPGDLYHFYYGSNPTTCDPVSNSLSSTDEECPGNFFGDSQSWYYAFPCGTQCTSDQDCFDNLECGGDTLCVWDRRCIYGCCYRGIAGCL